MDNKKKTHKKFKLHEKKDCAVKSLFEVNCFLNKLSSAKKLTKITHLIKSK